MFVEKICGVSTECIKDNLMIFIKTYFQKKGQQEILLAFIDIHNNETLFYAKLREFEHTWFLLVYYQISILKLKFLLVFRLFNKIIKQNEYCNFFLYSDA